VTCGENLMVQNYLNLEITQERGNYIVVIIGDATYSGKENLKITSGQSIKAVAYLNLSITQGFRKYDDKFDYNKDTDRFVYPAGTF
jgi:endo-alpha-1,4-polygalactosaminidase (GH114 family)